MISRRQSYAMTSQVCQKVCHDIQKYTTISKVCNEVKQYVLTPKMYVMMWKLWHHVKKYIMCIKVTSWYQDVKVTLWRHRYVKKVCLYDITKVLLRYQKVCNERQTVRLDAINNVRPKIHVILCMTSSQGQNSNINCASKNIRQWFIKINFSKNGMIPFMTSNKCLVCRMFKTEFRFYNVPIKLVFLSNCEIYVQNSDVRTLGCQLNQVSLMDIKRYDRVCTLCESHDMGDEFHYVFTSSFKVSNDRNTLYWI